MSLRTLPPAWRFAVLALILACAPAWGAGTADANANNGPGDADPFANAIEGLELREGFIDVYANADKGKVLALLPKAAPDGTLLRFIHALRLRDGLGSNPLGLDRGWGNSGQIIRLRRIGERVIAEVENHRYRANTEDSLERAAVASSFAVSFIWSTDIIAERDDGSALIDLSGLLTADLLGLGDRLGGDGGSFRRADERSLPDADSLLVFPDNVEIDAFITFSASDPGGEVRATAPADQAVTLVQHHSLVRLPDDGYKTRPADARTGTFVLGFYDYASDLDQPLLDGYAMRHRLQFNEPGRPESGVREPIVFFIDSGAPEPVRQALIDGASWWADAFAAAGFENGFQVKLLPANAHPQDIRYNVVQWVHRQTRGWSFGGGIIDPRTGEIIKGHVVLGSQRVRHDRMIFEGLAGVEAVDSGQPDDPVALSLARIRQLAAHELGHALGFGHNFIASHLDRASVMDYPAPWIRATDEGLDFSAAYDAGIGRWDEFTAEWLYREFPPGADQDAELDALVRRAVDDGLRFIADQHGRSVSGAHPDASVWDNGDDAVAELENVLAVRDRALRGFGADRIAKGRPLADLRQVLTPIYLYHRYQIDAAAKALGGARFAYSRRGGPGESVRPVPAGEQRRALNALLETLAPEVLALPDRLQTLLPPAHDGYWFNAPREALPARTSPLFDPFSAAETAAELTFNALLDARRAERLVAQHALDPTLPGLNKVLEATRSKLIDHYRGAESGAALQIAQRLIERYATALMRLDTPGASGAVRASADGALNALAEILDERRLNRQHERMAFNRWLAGTIRAWRAREAEAFSPLRPAPEIPAGSPIGARAETTAGDAPDPAGLDRRFLREDCWHCSGN